MGRCYNGKGIKGKFWFGIQDSSDPEFFGARVSVNHVRYNLDEMDEVEAGIKECERELGNMKKILDDFYSLNDSWTWEDLMRKTGTSKETLKYILTWYARLELGEKIKECMENNYGHCSFEAEC